MREGWANNQHVRLHYVEHGIEKNEQPALVICPGLSEPAENYLPLLTALTDRRGIALSFRGRGKSDAPDTGYSPSRQNAMSSRCSIRTYGWKCLKMQAIR
ncbi:hypothetical protein JQN58_19410 [Aneurinibacillus sp. BA2021]|nr:hypothetical protein [Aneurinibacillus sp. BA2021]